MLEILSDSDDQEHEEMVEWLKGHAKNYPYDPDFFDPDSVKFWNPQKRWRMMMGLET